MQHTIHSRCPACEEQRTTVVEIQQPEKTVLVACDCGQFFAVHLRVSVHTETVSVPKPKWAATPMVLPFSDEQKIKSA